MILLYLERIIAKIHVFTQWDGTYPIVVIS